MRLSLTRPFGVGVVVCSLLMAGCSQSDGPELAPVKGVITLDGEPLEEANIVFQPSGKKAIPSFGFTSTDGTFELLFGRKRKGAMIGKHVVQITTKRLVADESGKETTIREKVPTRYNEKSELRFEVTPGKNEFEITLNSKGKS